MFAKSTLAAAALTLSAALPVFAADQTIDLSSGSASFASSSPVLEGGDDVITFTGLASGVYNVLLSLSGQNVSGVSASLNGAPATVFPYGPLFFGGLVISSTSPLVLSLQGTALGQAQYAGTLSVSAVPEPQTYALMLAGVAALLAKHRRNRQA